MILGLIDAHMHVQPWDMLKPDIFEMLVKSRSDADLLLSVMKSPERFISYLDEQGVEKAVIINYPSPRVMGFTDAVNEFVLNYTKRYRDRLLPCGGVDFNSPPHDVESRVVSLIKGGMKAFKIQTAHQYCYANDYLNNKSMEVFYNILEKEGLPVIIHTGTSIFPGARNRFTDPIYIDDVAVDFPDLKIVIAHIGRPLWPDSALFLLRRHRNVFADISSIPPKKLLEYFPRLEDVSSKLMFGSDWPAPGVPEIKRNVQDFLNLDLPTPVKQNILSKNALNVYSWS